LPEGAKKKSVRWQYSAEKKDKWTWGGKEEQPRGRKEERKTKRKKKLRGKQFSNDQGMRSTINVEKRKGEGNRQKETNKKKGS